MTDAPQSFDTPTLDPDGKIWPQFLPDSVSVGPARPAFSIAPSAGDVPTIPYTSPAFAFLGVGPGALDATHGKNTTGNNTASSFEWHCDAPYLDIRLNGSNLIGSLYVDGQLVNPANITTNASGGNFLLRVDFAGVARPRHFRWVAVNQSFGGIIIPSEYTAWRPAIDGALAWWLGDSYTFGTGAVPLTEGQAYVAMRELGWAGVPDGWGGSGLVASADGSLPSPQTRINAKLKALNYAPNFIVIDLLYNNSASDIATMVTNFNESIALIRAFLPKARIFVKGTATPLGMTSALQERHNAIKDRCTALGLDFIDTSGWITAANKSRYTGPDNQHPNPDGHEYLGQRVAAVIKQRLKQDPPAPVAVADPPYTLSVSGFDHRYMAPRAGAADGASIATWPDLVTSTPFDLKTGTNATGSFGTVKYVSDADGGYVRLLSESGKTMTVSTDTNIATVPRTVVALVRAPVSGQMIRVGGTLLTRLSDGTWRLGASGSGANTANVLDRPSVDGWVFLAITTTASAAQLWVGDAAKVASTSWTPGTPTSLRLSTLEADRPTDVRELVTYPSVLSDADIEKLRADFQAHYSSV